MASDRTGSSMEYASVLSKTEHTSSAFETRPTIFDILASENMHALFRPAFNHVLKWLATVTSSKSPLMSARLRTYSNELYVLAHSALELLYLREYDACFAEYFYGLKRVPPLTPPKRVLSILVSVVVPYLKSRLDEFYEELEKTLDSTVSHRDQNVQTEPVGFIKRVVRVLKKLMLNYYRYFHLIWSLTFWLGHFRFMINQSDQHSPLLSILKLRLVYNLNRDDSAQQPNEPLVRKAMRLANHSFTNILFFVQFLKWFYDYRENRSYALSAHPNSDPPNPSDSNAGDDFVPEPKLADRLAKNKTYKALSQSGLCPLCNKKRSNQCALSVSGFVFCYPCIFRFVKENKRCPLTHFPCTTKNIVRIYSASNES